MSCTLTEHTIDSFRALTLSDGEHSLTLLPEKGSDIISLRHEKTETEFLWTSPNGLRHDSATKNFYDSYEGGWQECFPIGGPAMNYRGAQIGQHGEVHALAWEVIAQTESRDEVSVTLRVKTVRTPFVLTKKITLRGGTGMIEIDESVQNVGTEDLPILWGQHPTFGGNFLSSACKIDSPAEKIVSYSLPEHSETGQFDQAVSGEWPFLKNKQGELIDISEMKEVDARTADMLFLTDFTDGWIAITNRERRVGVAFLFDPQKYPVFWLWQMYGGGTGYPWYGRAYTVGLAPFSGMPDPHAVNIDAVPGVVYVGAGATHSARLRMLIYKGIKGVGRISPEGVIVPRI